MAEEISLRALAEAGKIISGRTAGYEFAPKEQTTGEDKKTTSTRMEITLPLSDSETINGVSSKEVAEALRYLVSKGSVKYSIGAPRDKSQQFWVRELPEATPAPTLTINADSRYFKFIVQSTSRMY